MKTYKLIFSGIILPEHDINQVRTNISKLLKLTNENANVFFSGKSILIKKDLTLEKAHSIKQVLEKNGLLINLVEENKTEITEISTTSTADSLQQNTCQQHNSIQTPQKNDIDPSVKDTPSFFSFSFDGRYGRLNFMNAIWTIHGVTFLTVFVISLILKLPNTPFFFNNPVILVIFLMQYFHLRCIALRFHDLNKSDWWCLLTLIAFIPVIGGLFFLILIIYLCCAKGTSGKNNYGEQPKQGHIIGLILTCSSSILVIIAIAMFAISAYKDYTNRTYVAEGIALASGIKLAVTEYYNNNKKLPSSNQEAHLPNENAIRGTSVTSVKVIPYGNIVIQYNESLNFGTIILTPQINNDFITWECNQGTIPKKVRPMACQ